MKGDAAVQAVASQPWDPSVKSLVAFPALLAMMGENPPWVENLGNAFLAQPHDVMDSVQRLRAIAQQTGTLKSTPQQKVIVTPARYFPDKQIRFWSFRVVLLFAPKGIAAVGGADKAAAVGQLLSQIGNGICHDL